MSACNPNWCFLFLLLSLLPHSFALTKEEKTVNIGAFFESKDSQLGIPIRSAIAENNYYFNENILFNFNVEDAVEDPFKASKKLCSLLQQPTVSIFGGESPTASSPILQSICSSFQIPYIHTSWSRSGMFVPSETLLNFYPDSEMISQAIAAIAGSGDEDSFIILYEDYESLTRLKGVLKLKPFEVKDKHNTIIVKKVNPNRDHRSLLKELRPLYDMPILIDCRPETVRDIFQQMKNMGFYFNYIFLASLDSHTLDSEDLPKGSNITSIRIFDFDDNFHGVLKKWETSEFRAGKTLNLTPFQVTTETFLTYVAISAMIEALNSLKNNEIIKHSVNCDNETKFQHGPEIVSFMKTNNGHFQFDEFGRRTNVTFYVIEGIGENVIATWNSDTAKVNLLRDANMLYDSYKKRIVNTTITVSTRLGEPFLGLKIPGDGETLEGNDRFEGYTKDFIEAIAGVVGFNYELQLTADGKYGSFNKETGLWDGIIGDVYMERVHLGVCDLTITPEREEYVDFSMPFMKSGIDVLYKTAEQEVKLFNFLGPLTIEVWMFIGTLYLLNSVILFLVARMAPDDWENPNPNDPNPEELESIWNLKNCLWITFASIMNQGTEDLPRAFSSRVTSSSWSFFTLIITNTYLASLAAFLNTNQPAGFTDISDLTKQNKINYGVIKGGATEAFFRTSNYSTYVKMYANMVLNDYDVFELSNQDGVKRVLNTKDGLYAFLMESTIIEYVIERHCDLKTIKKPIHSRSYGIAMPINYPFRTMLNDAILKLQEGGTLNDLKNKWWKFKNQKAKCSSSQSGPELTLQHVGGVFLVLFVGLGLGLLLGIFEFLWNVWKVSVRKHVSLWEVFKFEVKFAVNVFVTKKKCLPQRPDVSQ